MRKRIAIGFVAALCLAPAISLVSAPAIAAEVDTSTWVCSGCPVVSGWENTLDFGLGHVSDDSANFGDYRGLEDEGVYAIIDGGLRYRGDQGRYAFLRVDDLGLDARSLTLTAGDQGLYKVSLAYSNLPHLRFDTGATPFSVSGGNLNLPDGWVTAGGSRVLSGLDAALWPVEIATERERYGIDLAFTPKGRLSYELGYRHENRDGLGIRSGSFITQFTQLPERIDYRTEALDAAVTYLASRGQLKLSYYGSWFANSNTTLTWDNPFTELVPGADAGRLASPPDNQAHSLSLSGSYRLAGHTRVAGTLSAGQMTQDDAFTTYTLTPGLTSAALPFQSLDAEVRTTRLHLRAVNQAYRRLRLSIDYDYNDRDNKTRLGLFETIQSDLFPAGDPRRNRPYSFERQKLRAQGRFRFEDGAMLSAGYEFNRIERDQQEVARTDDDQQWVKFRLPRTLPAGGGATFKALHSERDGSDYQVPENFSSLQNPLLRKFNMADRERDQFEFKWPVAASDKVDLALNFSTSKDNYDNSPLGLQESEWMSVLLDGSVHLGGRTSITGSFTHESFDTRQTGSESFGNPDWAADNEDTINTSTLGFRWDSDSAFGSGIDVTYARAQSNIVLATPNSVGATFPELQTRLTSARGFVDYRANDNLLIRASILYERFRSDDWGLDEVDVTRLPAAILLGLESPAYNVTVFGLSFRYQPGQPD